MTETEIFNYKDYRSYLKDHLQSELKANPGYSVRAFSLKAGISTENYLNLVIEGKRNLGPLQANRFIRAIPLKGNRARYFMAMVMTKTGRSNEMRNQFAGEMKRLASEWKKRHSERKLSQDHSIIDRWYLPVVWELASCSAFSLTPKSVTEAFPSDEITLEDAKRALDLLVSKGYLIWSEEEKRLIQGKMQFSLGSRTDNLAIQAYHRDWWLRAARSVTLPKDTRGHFGLHLAFDSRRMDDAKARILQFLENFQNEFGADPQADVVYQVGATCFPVARIKKP